MGIILLLIGLALIAVSSFLNYMLCVSLGLSVKNALIFMGINMLLGVLFMLIFAIAIGWRFKPTAYWQKVGEDEYYEYYERKVQTPTQKKINAMIGIIIGYFMALILLTAILDPSVLSAVSPSGSHRNSFFIHCAMTVVGMIIGGIGLRKTMKAKKRAKPSSP